MECVQYYMLEVYDIICCNGEVLRVVTIIADIVPCE